MNCPKCAAADVRQSRRPVWTDTFYSLLGRQPFRCRKCNLRFYSAPTGAAIPASVAKRHGSSKKRPRNKQKPPRRMRPWMWETAIFLVMLVIFLIFLRYLTREPTAGLEGSEASFNLHAIQV